MTTKKPSSKTPRKLDDRALETVRGGGAWATGSGGTVKTQYGDVVTDDGPNSGGSAG